MYPITDVDPKVGKGGSSTRTLKALLPARAPEGDHRDLCVGNITDHMGQRRRACSSVHEALGSP